MAEGKASGGRCPLYHCCVPLQLFTGKLTLKKKKKKKGMPLRYRNNAGISIMQGGAHAPAVQAMWRAPDSQGDQG